MIDWDALRIVLAIAREGSLSAAAIALEVNQATVGRHLRRAEVSLETRLFDRFNFGLQPTVAGKKAIEVAKLIELEILNLSLEIVGSDHAETGKIRVSTPLGLMQYGLADDFLTFGQRYPDIDVEISATDSALSFVEREVDVFIRAEDNPSNGLWGFKLAELNFGFYASSMFLKTWQPEMISDPETAEVPFIKRSISSQGDDLEFFRKVFPNAKPVMECEDLDSLVALIKAGVGVGRIPHFIGNSSPNLEAILAPKDSAGITLWILTYPDLKDTKRIRVFMELVKSSFHARRVSFENAVRDG